MQENQDSSSLGRGRSSRRGRIVLPFLCAGFIGCGAMAALINSADRVASASSAFFEGERPLVLIANGVGGAVEATRSVTLEEASDHYLTTMTEPIEGLTSRVVDPVAVDPLVLANLSVAQERLSVAMQNEAQARQEIEKRATVLEEKKAAASVAEEKLDAARADSELAQVQVVNRQQVVEAAQTKLAEADEKLDEATAEVTASTADLEAARSDLEQATAQVGEAKTSVTEATQLVKETQAAITEATVAQEEAKASLDVAAEAAQEAQKEAEQINTADSMTADLAALMADLMGSKRSTLDGDALALYDYFYGQSTRTIDATGLNWAPVLNRYFESVYPDSPQQLSDRYYKISYVRSTGAADKISSLKVLVSSPDYSYDAVTRTIVDKDGKQAKTAVTYEYDYKTNGVVNDKYLSLCEYAVLSTTTGGKHDIVDLTKPVEGTYESIDIAGINADAEDKRSLADAAQNHFDQTCADLDQAMDSAEQAVVNKQQAQEILSRLEALEAEGASAVDAATQKVTAATEALEGAKDDRAQAAHEASSAQEELDAAAADAALKAAAAQDAQSAYDQAIDEKDKATMDLIDGEQNLLQAQDELMKAQEHLRN